MRLVRSIQARSDAPGIGIAFSAIVLAMLPAVLDQTILAAHGGDFEGLLAVLDSDVVLRADGGGVAELSRLVRGAEVVASSATMWSRVGLDMHRALVNGTPGFVSLRDGRPFSVAAVTVRGGRIVEMDILADPERLAGLELTVI